MLDGSIFPTALQVMHGIAVQGTHSMFEIARGAPDIHPHGYCLNWSPQLLQLHVVSSAIISFAYKVIPAALAYISWKRRKEKGEDMKIFWLFFAFIVLCGFTHDLEILVLWDPWYTVQGWVKAVTALVSFVVAIFMVLAVKPIVALPSYAENVDKNRRLQEICDALTYEIARPKSSRDAIDQLSNRVKELRDLVGKQ